MKNICFFVAGQAVPKGRPRFFRRGRFFGTYTPTATRSWEQFVQFQALEYAPKNIPECPIELSVTFYLPRPKTLPKKVTHHIKKPDCDNLVKCIKDALEGMFFKNDSQIFCMHVQKEYVIDGVTKEGAGISLQYYGEVEQKGTNHGKRND